MMHIKLSLFLLTLFFSSAVMAINVMPFSGELDLTKQPNYKISVSNKSQNEAAVKITVQKWSFDRYGEEVRSPSNDLIIFPKRMLLPANGERSVRVSYRRGVSPRLEGTYRIIVEEIPLAKKRNSGGYKGASISVLTRYVTSFYVKPRNAGSDIKVVESSAHENGFQLKIRNKGNAHTHFISPSMTIRQSGKKLIITDLELLKPFSSTNIFAFADRVYDWEVPENLRQALDFSRPYKVIIDWVCENCSGKTDQISFVVE